LDSITKTPKIHRSELIRFVHKPELSTISYHAFDQKETGRPKALERLLEIRNALDIMRDPYVLQLIEQRDDGDPEAGRRLQMTLMKRNTYCQKQINGIVVKTVEMFDELGPWATDWLLRQCKTRLEKLMDSEQLQICLGNTEKQYIHAVIQRSLQGSEAIPTPVRMPHCTPKVHALINILLAESSPGFKGIIFAEQRATVVVLAQLLSVHDQTKDAFRLGTFVGTSVNSNRKMSIVDLAEPRQQQQVLDDFRDGRKNLIIATSVLEEGIDISSCHLVINFDPPKNLKSFVQRRGRARKEKSKYIILKPPTSPAKSSADLWESLEEDMKAAYMNDLREAKAAEERELIEENSALSVRVPGTE
jgi:ERCC4-related helicase